MVSSSSRYGDKGWSKLHFNGHIIWVLIQSVEFQSNDRYSGCDLKQDIRVQNESHTNTSEYCYRNSVYLVLNTILRPLFNTRCTESS